MAANSPVIVLSGGLEHEWILRQHESIIHVAKKQLRRASVDAWEPTDAASCVTNVFYAYENLIVATAEAEGVLWTKNHYEKAELARNLWEKNLLSKDLRDELLRLNDLRKDVSYGEAGDELSDEDLETLVVDLETFLDEVDAMVTGKEEAEAGE